VLVYKILDAAEWHAARRSGRYDGSADDRRDGFIHLSSAIQAAETARRHFRGRRGLVLLAIDASSLAPRLTWEPSRRGELFPHLYGALSCELVEEAREIDS
jgi:uncharacterized protein (DUF952 family)